MWAVEAPKIPPSRYSHQPKESSSIQLLQSPIESTSPQRPSWHYPKNLESPITVLFSTPCFLSFGPHHHPTGSFFAISTSRATSLVLPISHLQVSHALALATCASPAAWPFATALLDAFAPTRLAPQLGAFTSLLGGRARGTTRSHGPWSGEGGFANVVRTWCGLSCVGGFSHVYLHNWYEFVFLLV